MQNKKSNKRKKGFTLAEVLLTMTIIGIIAALTIPSLITSTSKSETEARLQKFYALMSQTVELAETDYDSDILNIVGTSSGMEEFLENYLKGSYVDESSYFNFNDGTRMNIDSFSDDEVKVSFCVNPNSCSTVGVDKFYFYFTDDGFVTNNSGTTCNNVSCTASSTNGSCTQVIQCNGWKIPDNYPLDI